MTKKDLELYRKFEKKSQEEQKHFKISNESLRRMNNTIIKNHNERVNKDDIVFFIGDFCFRNSPGGKKGEGTITKAKEYEKKLNGKLIFIKGNHDRNNSCKTIIERLGIKYGGKRINLTHDPEHADVSYEINFCGHVHNRWKFRRIRKGYSFTDIINVGVDVNNFQPKTFEELFKEYSKWKRTLKTRFEK